MRLKYKTLQNGMTLIEIFIVITIIGILAAIAIPSLSNHLITAERKKAQIDLYQLKIWVEQQYTSNGEYPSEISCLSCDLSEKYTYTINIGSTENNAYKIKATPKTTSIQINDSQCYTMIINAASQQSNQSKEGNNLNNDNCWI